MHNSKILTMDVLISNILLTGSAFVRIMPINVANVALGITPTLHFPPTKRCRLWTAYIRATSIQFSVFTQIIFKHFFVSLKNNNIYSHMKTKVL